MIIDSFKDHYHLHNSKPIINQLKLNNNFLKKSHCCNLRMYKINYTGRNFRMYKNKIYPGRNLHRKFEIECNL